MKTFKQFFEDNDLGTVDIIARPEQGQPTNLGQTDNTGVKKIANYVNDHDKKLRIKTVIKPKDSKRERVFLDISDDLLSDSRFQIKDTTIQGIVNGMVFLKSHFEFLSRDIKTKSQKRNDSPDHDIYKK